MDINAKMTELEALWQDSFDLCKVMVESCKNGDQKLTGSLLKEINAFIKQSVEFLKYREAEQAFGGTEEAEEAEDAELKELLDSVVSTLDGGGGDDGEAKDDDEHRLGLPPAEVN